MKKRTVYSNTYLFVLLAVIAFAVRIFYLGYFNYDGLYGQDAYAYLEFSKGFYQSLINFQIPQNYYWPIGFYFFSSLFALLTGGSSALASLLVSLNAGALSAGFIYLLSYEILKKYYPVSETKKYSFIAGLVICMASITVKTGVTIMSDALGFLFIVISAYYLVKYINEQKRVHIVICFIAYSFGLITRYADGLFIIPVFIAIYFVFRKSVNKQKIITDTAVGIFFAVLIFLPQLYYIVKYGVPYFQYKGDAATWAAGWSPVNIFRSDFKTFDGTQHYKFFNGMFYSSPALHPLFLSAFFFAFLYGIVNAFRKINKTISIFLIVWIAIYIIYLAGNPYQSIRYTLSFFPPLVIISMSGLAGLKTNSALKTGYIAVSLLLISGYSFYDFDKFAERKKKEIECVEWISKNVTEGANLFTFEITDAVKHYNGIQAKEFYSFSFNDIKQMTDTAKERTFFLLPAERIHSQWKGLPVEGSFDSLINILKPISIGKVNNYEGFLLAK